MKIKITADSTCDLSPELIEKYDIGIIPLYITKDDKSFRDGIDITPLKIFEDVEAGMGIYKTAAVNIPDYTDVFSEYLKTYDAVIHIDISSDFSACYQNACIAADTLENVYVVDSRNLSTGTGHIVLDAAMMAEKEMCPEDIVDRLKELTAKLDVSFVIDTLKYLRLGGRCSSVAALGANLLKLKPCIEVVNGKMTVGKKYRGNIDKVVSQYIKEHLEGQNDIDYRRIFITCSPRTDDAVVNAAKNAVEKYGKFEEIYETLAGCTVSNHCGPNTLGILFYRK